MLSNRLRLHLLIATLFCLASPLAQALEISAQLHWSKRVAMSTPMSGVIKMVNAQAGQRVKKGTVMISLDQRGFKAAVNMAKAKVTNLNEVQLEAKREQDRAQELYDRTVLSDHDLQTAKNGYTAALSKYETAKAELVQAQLDLEYSSLTAPFDAMVLQRNGEIGQTVVSQLKPEALLVIADANHMLARGQIARDDLTGINLNGDIQKRSATVVVNGQRYKGTVRQVGMEPIAGKEGLYLIEVEFKPGKRSLRAGQQAKIQLK